jgi:hypothetical protein
MNLYLQYGIVFLAVVAAAWVSWRKLTGRHVFRRGRKPDGCAGCDSAQDHQR